MATIKFAMVCYSNQNRSMEAHKVLAEAGFDVVSYGVGTCVRLPGPSQHEPNIYEFGTPYRSILRDLKSKPASHQPHYERLGLYSMLERNVKVKEKPEKWQLSDVGDVDVAITFEERVMDTMLEDMAFRTTQTMKPLLIVNLEVPDNNKEALAAAQQVSTLAAMLQQASKDAGDWRMLDISDLLNKFEKETGRKTLFSVAFF